MIYIVLCFLTLLVPTMFSTHLLCSRQVPLHHQVLLVDFPCSLSMEILQSYQIADPLADMH